MILQAGDAPDFTGYMVVITSSPDLELSQIGQQVVAYDPATATLTMRRASFWLRLRHFPGLVWRQYRILRQGAGRWRSAVASLRLAAAVLR